MSSKPNYLKSQLEDYFFFSSLNYAKTLLDITFFKLAPINLVELRLILIKKLMKYP